MLERNYFACASVSLGAKAFAITQELLQELLLLPDYISIR